MKNVKFYYNKNSLQYEKVETTLKTKILRGLMFSAAVVVSASLIVFAAYNLLDSPKERLLKREVEKLEFEYDLINRKIDEMDKVLTSLERKDDHTYRTIFEAEPLDDNQRNASIGGIDLYNDLENYTNSDLMVSTKKKLDKLGREMVIQSKSYDELWVLIKNKSKMLASIPAIQPVDNENLTRMASGYGMRIDPIYKVPKMHSGMDFTAPRGTDIFATGDGEIVRKQESNKGYGYNVIIDHGYGFKTLYAHMQKINVVMGQKVKRGDVLGEVGSTGKSTAPHLHYEVMKDGKKINPINYYYNDLTPEEYDKMIELSATHNQSFD